MSAARADYAARYVELDMALVPLPPRAKAPRRKDWQRDANLITSIDRAREHWRRHPDQNIGVCLEPSRLVSLDADYLDGARAILAAEGVDLDSLIASAPTIVGRAPRIEFRAPAVELDRKPIAWPPRRLGDKPITVLELRAGRCQDLLPPSIHPDTRRPYQWLTPPHHGFPPLPDPLLELWLDFDRFRERALSLCPWRDPRPQPKPIPAKRAAPYNGPSVIANFNATHEVGDILRAHGYRKVAKGRFMSPDGHGAAGVVILRDGLRVLCHHTSDALGDGLPHDAFDLYTLLAHGGDRRAAVREAAQLLETSK